MPGTGSRRRRTRRLSANYYYDGIGDRFEKVLSNGQAIVSVYDAFGNLAEEYSPPTTWSKDFVPFNGQTVAIENAKANPCTTCYLSYDYLGTPRLVTDQNANVMGRYDYLLFGDEIPGGVAGRSSQFGPYVDNVNQKFTGHYRDTETLNDFFNARYYTAPLVRFLFADPASLAAVDPTDPQTWNAYAYVRNNPLVLVDPSGLSLLSALGNFFSGLFGGGGQQYCLSFSDGANCGGGGDTGTGDFSFGYMLFPNRSPLLPLNAPGEITFSILHQEKGPVPTVSTPSNQQLVPPKTGTRNCSASSASVGQYAAATAQVALLTGQFFSGLGSADQNFGPNSATSQVMAQSGPVQDVLNDYYMTGRTSNLYAFGASGHVAAGANPVAQLVGSFRYTISPTNGGIDLRLTNTTSFRSLTYDKGPQWQRGSFAPMGNTHQVYNIFIPCGG